VVVPLCSKVAPVNIQTGGEGDE